MIPDILIERFHEKFEVDKETGCWNWTASTAGKGYGQIKIPGTRRQTYAHRLSYQIHIGEIPDGMVVCHKCDNPKCVNPDHFFLGTIRDNLMDMKNKDRHLKGERNTVSKLTELDVEMIFDLLDHGLSTYEIARRYDLAQSTVWKISTGIRWEHIYKRRRSNDST